MRSHEVVRFRDTLVRVSQHPVANEMGLAQGGQA